MQQWNVIYLISYEEGAEVDDYGDPVRTEVRRKVYAKARSITRTEFYQAQTVGEKPVLKFYLATSRDYQEEEELAYNGKRYKIQRSYTDSADGIELTCYGGVRDEHA